MSTGTPDPPRWWQVARKAVVAAAVALTAAAGVIVAAVADEHVTLSEWVAIGLALAAAVAGPYGVYKARNAPEPYRAPPVARRQPEHRLEPGDSGYVEGPPADPSAWGPPA